ncbi:MAG: hypothetical protein A2516_05095 [Alphaproteobacteria bacterium RIFOXYD12_FULL_60_8]|nr:MAG: hypothetical protein A2516_05095 [Alphaproteobacteria bacterium RIFOXYD12_FULL_60_8]
MGRALTVDPQARSPHERAIGDLERHDLAAALTDIDALAIGSVATIPHPAGRSIGPLLCPRLSVKDHQWAVLRDDEEMVSADHGGDVGRPSGFRPPDHPKAVTFLSERRASRAKRPSDRQKRHEFECIEQSSHSPLPKAYRNTVPNIDRLTHPVSTPIRSLGAILIKIITNIVMAGTNPATTNFFITRRFDNNQSETRSKK